MANIIEVTDFQHPALDVFARLTQLQLRSRLEPEKGIFIAESPKVISRALDAGCVPLSLLMERKHIDGEGAAIIESIYAGVSGTDFPQFYALGRLYMFVEWLLKSFPKASEALPDRAREYFFSIINYIEVQGCSEMNVQRISRQLGFDRTYIFKLFKRFIGVSPSFYIECLKTYTACRLLEQNKYSLREAASRRGFPDYSWFCKVFKKCAGVSPNEYVRTDNKAAVLNGYNLTIPRNALADLERFSKNAWQG